MIRGRSSRHFCSVSRSPWAKLSFHIADIFLAFQSRNFPLSHLAASLKCNRRAASVKEVKFEIWNPAVDRVRVHEMRERRKYLSFSSLCADFDCFDVDSSACLLCCDISFTFSHQCVAGAIRSHLWNGDRRLKPQHLIDIYSGWKAFKANGGNSRNLIYFCYLLRPSLMSFESSSPLDSLQLDSLTARAHCRESIKIFLSEFLAVEIIAIIMSEKSVAIWNRESFCSRTNRALVLRHFFCEQQSWAGRRRS